MKTSCGLPQLSLGLYFIKLILWWRTPRGGWYGVPSGDGCRVLEAGNGDLQDNPISTLLPREPRGSLTQPLVCDPQPARLQHEESDALKIHTVNDEGQTSVYAW